MEPKMNEWHEVLNEQDINALMEFYLGFHDACLVSLNYVSGTFVDYKRAMHFNGAEKCTLSVVFHSQWNDYELELYFVGVCRFNIIGVEDGCSSEILEASLKFCDNLHLSSHNKPERFIVWAENYGIDDDSDLTELDDTYVIARSLKWRLL